MRILVLNGPNLDLLGTREPDVYGSTSLSEIMDAVTRRGSELGVEVVCEQSNDEGALVTRVGHAGKEFAGIVFNPAGYTHTSVALHDAIKASGIPVVEVHLSNIHARDAFRQTSLTAPASAGIVAGFGQASYVLGLEALIQVLQTKDDG